MNNGRILLRQWVPMASLKLLLLLLILRSISAGGLTVTAPNFQSPCPENFQYSLENGELQYGLIQVLCPRENVIQLNVELSVGNDVQGYNGDLELAISRAKTIDNVLNRQPITYRLHFPRWINIPPKITKILLNGVLVCSGPPINIKSVRVLTTINLQHTLRINAPIPLDTTPKSRFDKPMVIPDFNPIPPKDPSRIYPEKPFQFSTTTNAPFLTELPPRSQIPEESDFKSLGLNDDICGLSAAANSLVANGFSVEKGQYPWLVAIFIVKSLGPEFLCGASLITKKHVLTAAHCMKPSDKVHELEKIFLRLGQHNIHQWTPISGTRTIGVSDIAVHPDYRAMSSDADIAMITLSEDVAFTKLIRPICFWTEPNNLDFVIGHLGTIVGWGKDENNNLIAPEPKQVKFPIVSQEDCLRSHITFREITSKRTFCAGYRNGSGPCNGDSGGGFTMIRGSRWTLRGIVSMSLAKDKTCDYSQYFVFSDVTKLTDWIVDVIKNKR